MGTRILITGGAGAIGTALQRSLEQRRIATDILDLRASGDSQGDVRDEAAVRRAVRRCSGIVHLAAISRVAWGERDPDECHSINVGGTRTVLAAASEAPDKPWVLLTSSREIYGEPAEIPVKESAIARPVNTYGRSKADAEGLVTEAARGGLRAAVVRLSNVYGSAQDHTDRVVPALVRAALRGEPLDVCGTQRTFDFTHIDDTVRGLSAMMALLDQGNALPPIHLVTGVAVTLGEVARIAVEVAGSGSIIRERPIRTFEVSRFVGDPGRARALLGWEARIALREGIERLIRQWRTAMADEAMETRAS